MELPAAAQLRHDRVRGIERTILSQAAIDLVEAFVREDKLRPLAAGRTAPREPERQSPDGTGRKQLGGRKFRTLVCR